MIGEERIISYINSLYPDMEGVLSDIEREAIETDVPIIRRETRQWIKTILMMKKPKQILEVGTAVGFSAIFMASIIGDCKIDTIENWQPRIEIAKNNFGRAGVEDRITLYEGDGAEVMKTLDGPYDLIFMDAAKGQYIKFLPELKRLLSKGGVIISDNVLQDGEVLDSRFVVERRNRTIHERMREYLYALTHTEGLSTAIIPIGDGVALTVADD